jgi:sec-independent protein translocase protein TatA
MLGNIGPLEIGIVLVVALLVFGPKRLPELGGSLGKGIRDFGKGIKGEDDDLAAIEPAVEPEIVSAQASTTSN